MGTIIFAPPGLGTIMSSFRGVNPPFKSNLGPLFAI